MGDGSGSSSGSRRHFWLRADVASGRELGEPIPVPKPPTFVSLAPDGRHAAVIVRDRPLRNDWERFETTGVWLYDLSARKGASRQRP